MTETHDSVGTAGRADDGAAPADPYAPRPEAPKPDGPQPRLLRSRRQKVLGGVCGGLGRFFDVDPVIFRIVLGVLTVTGGVGLIFYGFAWLLLPLEGEEENEGRRLLSGRVDGASLTAVLLALIGCGLFLSVMNNGSTIGFTVTVVLAVAGSAVWSRNRRAATAADADPRASAAAHAVKVAPPETKAPPVPGSPSWWRDPIVKDGTTGPVSGDGYLWGPSALADQAAATRIGMMPDRPGRSAAPDRRTRGPRSIGGLVFLLAMLAGGLGTALSWQGEPLGTSLQIGLAAALGVFGIGLVVASFLGRTGFGTILMVVLTAGLLALAAALPKSITTEWKRSTWTPATAAAVQPHYEVGSGVGTLDLSRIVVPPGERVTTSVDVGLGQLKVVVPKAVTVEIEADAGVGDISLPDDPPGDIDVAPQQEERRTIEPPKGSPRGGTVSLKLDVGVGQVEVDRAGS
ncbi:PspC domain-containing protein [Streptomyces sp. NPDC050504]|uniref:PspC domain-containing protein n=1 Tax=Streptomyces sp. NPDC050504 TaxID=3365618 RepID=UPI0037ABE5A4